MYLYLVVTLHESTQNAKTNEAKQKIQNDTFFINIPKLFFWYRPIKLTKNNDVLLIQKISNKLVIFAPRRRRQPNIYCAVQHNIYIPANLSV